MCPKYMLIRGRGAPSSLPGLWRLPRAAKLSQVWAISDWLPLTCPQHPAMTTDVSLCLALGFQDSPERGHHCTPSPAATC